VPPETWFLEDEGYELAVSTPTSPRRRALAHGRRERGPLGGRPYLIYTVRTDELAGWRISSGSVEPLELRA
jgi:hypothetical protein